MGRGRTRTQTPAAAPTPVAPPNRRSSGRPLLRVLLAVGLCSVVTGCSGIGAGSDGTEARVDTPVVVVGVGGLAWEDISARDTPQLWELLTAGAAAGATTVRQSGPSCPADGWLALSAGRVVSGPRPTEPAGPQADDAAVTNARVGAEPEGPHADEDTDVNGAGPTGARSTTGDGTVLGGEQEPADPCGGPPAMREGAEGRASIDKWSELVELQDRSDFYPELGLLGETLAEADVCATAVGPGAALALADTDGTVGRYQESVGPGSFGCPITLIDAGAVVDPARDLPEVDRHLGDLLAQVPPDASVLVTSVSESPGSKLPELGVALLTGSPTAGLDPANREPARSTGTEDPRYLVTQSTRWDGVVRLLDVPSTLLAAVGATEPSDFSGAPIELGGSRPGEPEETVRILDDITRADRLRSKWADDLRTWLGGAQLVLYAGALLALGRRPPPPANGHRWALSRYLELGTRRALTAVVLLFAAIPVAAYLLTLTRWWRAASPDLALGVGLVAIAAAVAIVARLMVLGASTRAMTRVLAPGSTHRARWWVPGVLSLLTFVVLVVDAVTGTRLHRGSLLGPSPARGGRYFGFGNDTFCVLVVVALLSAGAVAAELLARDRRRLAVAAVLGLGGVTLLVDVWPTLGADVGGGLALLPGFALLTLVVAGTRVTAFRLAAATVGGVALVTVVALVDWLRPAQDRTHAGRFIQDLMDGDAWEIVSRKAGYARDSLNGSLAAWITLVVLVALVATVVRPERYAPVPLRAAFADWSTLRATLGAILLTVVIGSLLNDYGLRIATISLTMGLPLVALACIRIGMTGTDPATRPSSVLGADTRAMTRVSGPRSG